MTQRASLFLCVSHQVKWSGEIDLKPGEHSNESCRTWKQVCSQLLLDMVSEIGKIFAYLHLSMDRNSFSISFEPMYWPSTWVQKTASKGRPGYHVLLVSVFFMWQELKFYTFWQWILWSLTLLLTSFNPLSLSFWHTGRPLWCSSYNNYRGTNQGCEDVISEQRKLNSWITHRFIWIEKSALSA